MLSALNETTAAKVGWREQDRIDLIEEHIPHLRRYARFLTKNFEQADDMVQDCLLRAIENIDKWQPGTNMRAWLIVILRNNFFNHCRRQRRETEIKFDPGLAAANVSPAAQEDSMRLGELATAFSQLSHEHRNVIDLIVMDGMSYEDAADKLDVKVGTIKSRLSRARSDLRSLLDGDSAADEAPPPATSSIARAARSNISSRFSALLGAQAPEGAGGGFV